MTDIICWISANGEKPYMNTSELRAQGEKCHILFNTVRHMLCKTYYIVFIFRCA